MAASAPPRFRPMLAATGALPPSERGWAYELKYDGFRGLAEVVDGRLRLRSRTGSDLIPLFPELTPPVALGTRSAVLDGEVVVLGDGGRPDFGLLSRRLRLGDKARSAAARGPDPVAYLVFDVLWLDGATLVDRPYLERRSVLAGLGLDGDHWHVPPHWEEAGEALAVATRDLGLEGLVAKKVHSRYSQRRSSSWRKAKNWERVELVVGGWRRGPSGGMRSLLVGRPGPDGTLAYAGEVEWGFSRDERRVLTGLLSQMGTERCPFGPTVSARAGWVLPELVVELQTLAGSSPLRHSTFRSVVGPVRPTTP